MNVVNSKEYWDERFLSKDWENNRGCEQSRFFAKVAFSAMPEFLKRELTKNSWTVLDIGCAMGDGTAYLAKQFPYCRFTGQDISPAAVESAKNTYPHCDFIVGDISSIKKVDVVFSSNTLEHLKNPNILMEQMCDSAEKYVVHLLPFEDHYEIEEHINTFSYDTFPLFMGQFYLEYHCVIDCSTLENTCWFGKQILLVYTNRDFRPEMLTLLDARRNYGVFRLESELGASLSAIRRLEEEKRLLETKTSTVISTLEEEKRLLETKISTVISTLEEEKHLLETKNSEIQKQLDTETKKAETFENQYLSEKRNYDNLYAYSCKRDSELIALQNSKSYQFFIKWLRPAMSFGYRIVKAVVKLDFAVLKQELWQPFRKAYFNLKGKYQHKTLSAEFKKSIYGKRVVVFPPSIDWHMPLFQRPQQLALSYARKNNMAVVYVTKASQYDHIAFAEQVQPNLWVVNEQYLSEFPELLATASERIISIHWTLNKHYLDIIQFDTIIYEYIDELEIFGGYGPEMEQDHLRFLQEADVTVCTATKLYNQAAALSKNPILSPNAGDYDFFAKTDSYEINPLIRNIVKSYQCVIGYYGALASWFDYELIKTVAHRHPEWLFLLVGVNYDGSLDKSGIQEFKNIVYIPPQPYTELPSFLKAFDIASIPFLINEITLSTSPVKLFEYMAGGRPIIASKMPECLKYESVKTYDSAEEFCQIIDTFQTMNDDDPYWDVLKKDALDNTWDARTAQILNSLDSVT